MTHLSSFSLLVLSLRYLAVEGEVSVAEDAGVPLPVCRGPLAAAWVWVVGVHPRPLHVRDVVSQESHVPVDLWLTN